MGILWLILGVLAAFFVAWNNGSNNAPNSIGTAVGAGVISTRKALVIASIASFIGAITLGIYVTDTVMRGIVNISLLGNMVIVKGMIAVLLTTGLWTLLSTYAEVPMSVHVCIIGGIIGFGIATGTNNVSWVTVAKIFIAWIIVPFASAATAYLLYRLFSKSFRDPGYSRISVIIASYITIATPTVLLLIKNLSINNIVYTATITIVISTLTTLLIYYYWERKVRAGADRVHEASRILLIMAAVAMAYSFGSNDVANSAGPLAAILYALGYGNTITAIWLSIIVAAVGLSAGILLWGEKIIGTIGERITPLSPLSAYTAQMAATLTMLIVSRLGLPVSTSMAIVGGVMGTGLSRGIHNINLKLITRIFTLWLTALPATAIISYLLALFLIQYIPV